MNAEKLKEVSKIVKSFDINLTSEQAEKVAKRYLLYKLLDDQITNIIWAPCIFSVAYFIYTAAKMLMKLEF